MTLQTFVPYVPFLAVLYVLFAFVQALRHRRQGFGAALLALISIVAPLAAYLLSADTSLRASLIQSMTINAAIVFVASLLTLLIERRRKDRDPNRSYGLLGIGLSMLLVAGMFALPLIAATSASGSTPAAFNTAANTGSTVLVSAVTPGAALAQNTNSSAVQPQATPAASSTTPTDVALALEAQTGLSSDDVNTQTQAGTTIAALVAAHSGDLNAVVTAIASALDKLVAAGGMQAQMISSMGSDTTAIANQLVQGTLGQGQQFLLPQLITGNAPMPPGGGNPPSGSLPPSSDTSGAANAQPQATEDASQNSAIAPIALATNTPESQPSAASDTASQPQAAATEDIIRPTRIVFPTETPTPEATAEATAEANTSNVSASGDSAAAACALVVDYNLNLRDQPTTDGSTVLVSIPFGTSVSSSGHTADGWYSVSYDGKSGWVSGQYVTASDSCAALPILSAS